MYVIKGNMMGPGGMPMVRYMLLTPSQYPPPPQGVRGGPERMGPRPPPWVPLLKSYGSSILSTSLGSKTLKNTSSLGLGGTKI